MRRMRAPSVVLAGDQSLADRARCGDDVPHLCLLTTLEPEQMEPPQIFHYARGQEVKPHDDSLYDQSRPYGRDGACQSDRLATFLMI